jgi:hypothetical protein
MDFSSPGRKRAEQQALAMGLQLAQEAREREKGTAIIIDVPESPATRESLGLKVVAKESPVDRVRAIERAHPVPKEWLYRLAVIAPPSLTAAWLAFGWLEKVERWIIYECIPQGLIPPGKREQLGGTPYWKMPETLRVGRQQMVSAFQWEMYRKHQVWARPFWCLQGQHGGTPARYSEMEEALLKATGQETSPPAPGALPYCGFDGLAEQQLRARDRITKAGGSLDRIKRSGSSAVMLAETAEAERAFRETWYAWWKETMQPQVDFLDWFGKSDTRTAGVNAGLIRAATEEETLIGHNLEQIFVETGTVPITKAGE